jgi:DNA-binding CsgD family transcriptional regulator
MVQGEQDGDQSGSVTELEFRLTDDANPLVDASTVGDCRVALEEIVPRTSTGPLEFFSVQGAPAERVVDLTAEYSGIDPKLVEAFDDGGIIELRVSRSCPVATMGDAGAIPKSFVAEDGEAHMVGEVLPGDAADSVCERVTDGHPGVELLAVRERSVSAPTFTARQLQSAVDERLTDRQREVLTTAYLGGYYDDPRGATGAELADRLDIAPSTFANHLRAAEQAVVELLFAEGPDGGYAGRSPGAPDERTGR